MENDQRTALPVADRVAGWEQLAAFGLSAAAIAKRTGHKKTDVSTGLKAGEDQTGPHTWRHHSSDAARYLGQTDEWGYELSEIETYAVTGQYPAPADPPADGDTEA